MEFLDARYSDDRHVKLLQHCTVLAGDSEKYNPSELPDVQLVETFDENPVKEIGPWVKRNLHS